MRYILVVPLLCGLLCLGGCGGSSGGGTSDGSGSNVPEITTIEQLPTATSPMAASASASVSKDFGKAATTGLNLFSTSSSFFDSNKSLGACEMFNQIKEGISSAAQADMILCFVKQMDAAAKFRGLVDANGSSIDIYDGHYHIFNLNDGGTSQDEGAPNRVKMKISKDSNGNISQFEMFMCRLVIGGGGALEQNEYTSQTINGTDYAMRAIGSFQDRNGSGSHSVDVAGVLDTSGKFTNKVITIKNTGNWGGSNNWGEGTLTQTPAAFSFSGYHKGGYVDQQSGLSGTYEDRAYSLGQMLGDSSTSLRSLAMGEGAVLVGKNGSSPHGDIYLMVGSEAWNGDSGVPMLTNDYIANVLSGTLSTAQASLSLSFAATEQWDCSDDVGTGIVALPQIDFDSIENSCSDYNFSHEWIDCYNNIGSCSVVNVCQNWDGSGETACRACFPDGLKDSNTNACLVQLCSGNADCVTGMNSMCP